MSVITITIKSEGQAIDPAFMVTSVDVTAEVDRIADATIMFVDGDFASGEYPVADSALFQPGKVIEILARYGDQSDATIFKGPVVRTGLRINERRPTFTVEMRDASVVMTRRRQSRIFREAADSDVFSQIVGAAGLATGTVDATTPVHPEMVQYRVTDWDFLLSRAQAMGMCIVASQGEVSLRLPDLSAGADHEIDVSLAMMLDMELELDGLGAANGREASTWDLAGQERTAPTTGAAFSLEQGNLTAGQVADGIGYEAGSAVHMAPLDPEEVTAWSDGQVRRDTLGMLRGRIGLQGDGSISVLQLVDVVGISPLFAGRALVSGVRHRIDESGWRTDIALGVNRTRITETARIEEHPTGGLIPAAGTLQIGIADAFEEDPQGEQRIRVILPVVDGDDKLVWARLATPHAGAEHGIFFRPEVGDELVVGFMNSDPRHPVVLGALFGSANAPPEPYGAPTDENLDKGIVTRSGAKIAFTDADTPALVIETPAGNRVRLDDDGEALVLEDQHGNTVTMNADGIAMTSASDILIEASGKVEIKGQSVDIS